MKRELEELERKLQESGELTEQDVLEAFEHAKAVSARIDAAARELQSLTSRIRELTKEMGKDDLLTSKEVAPLVGVQHHKTVEAWVRTRGLPCVHLGRNLRFRRGDVLAWLAHQEK